MLEVLRDLAVVWVPFGVYAVIEVASENRAERKAMKKRHAATVKRIKANNAKRQARGGEYRGEDFFN